MKFRSLKILTDENISPRVVSFLREKGTDVIDTKEEEWHGKDDEYLLEKAYEFCIKHRISKNRVVTMKNELQTKLVEEIMLIPYDRLSELYNFIHFFRVGLETAKMATSPGYCRKIN